MLHTLWLNHTMRRAAGWILAIWFVMTGVVLAPTVGIADDRKSHTGRMWRQLVSEAEGLGLPTTFLKVIPPDFVRFEFDDLQTYAAEYHLGEHRLVLNRTLSFNGAGATLRPLGRLTHREIETLYHELFHAYMDYLSTVAEGALPERSVDPLLAFSRTQQHCRYDAVLISPVVQRKSETEERFLTERESWEALNETWAVFVGWVVWNQLELEKKTSRSIHKPGRSQDDWLARLALADREGSIRGYYEPEDATERAITRKRYLAPQSRLSSREMDILLRDVMGFSPSLLQRVGERLKESGKSGRQPSQCE